jgi:Family of unknown function (DUF6489)
VRRLGGEASGGIVNINITVECSPDEARQFFGLPDVKPLQAAVMAKIEKQMLDAVDAMSPEAMLRAWAPLVPQATEQFRDAFANLFRRPFGGSPESKS